MRMRSGPRHRVFERAPDQEREEAEKQHRLETLGQFFRTYRAPGPAPAHLNCALCARVTLNRVALTSARYIPLCLEHDAWDAASLVYVEGIDAREELAAAYAERERARTSG